MAWGVFPRAGVVDVLEGQVQLVLVMLRVAAVLGAADGEHAQQPIPGSS